MARFRKWKKSRNHVFFLWEFSITHSYKLLWFKSATWKIDVVTKAYMRNHWFLHSDKDQINFKSILLRRSKVMCNSVPNATQVLIVVITESSNECPYIAGLPCICCLIHILCNSFENFKCTMAILKCTWYWDFYDKRRACRPRDADDTHESVYWHSYL